MSSLPTWNARSGPLGLRKREIHLWRADLDRSIKAVPALKQTLGPEELAKAGQFRLELDRKRYIIAHGAFRNILARYLKTTPREPVFRYGPAGKPELASGVVSFNMSHADDLFLCAISLAPDVGVDVERVRPGVDQAVAGWLSSPRAQCFLEALPQPARRRAFFHGWTRLEAYIKARGEGPIWNQETFEACLDLRGPVLPSPRGHDGPHERWWFHEFTPRKGYVATLAAPIPKPKLTYWDLQRARISKISLDRDYNAVRLRLSRGGRDGSPSP
jgi:4'-phosphopantetheinyl transferase